MNKTTSAPARPLRAAALAVAAAALALAACAQQPAPQASSPTPRATPTAEAAQALSAFPASLAGHRRYVIELPAQPDEARRKVELIGGKTMTVDCNHHGMDGQFAERPLEGWGYTYWVLQSQGQAISTKMGCPPGSDRQAFVAAPSTLVRYNSRLPLVVFVPNGMELQWRLWQGGPMQAATAR